MKKTLAVILLATILATGTACSSGNNKAGDTTTAAQTTAPESRPEVLTLEDITAKINAIKAEYDAATEDITLSDKTVISHLPKNPGITVEDIENGTATREQMISYTSYIANIRRLVCDKLAVSFPVGNIMILGANSDGKDMGDFIFLDPVSAGYSTALELLTAMTEEEDVMIADYVLVRDNMVTFVSKTENTASVLCPNKDENAILTAVSAKLNPVSTEAPVSVAE